MTPQNVVVKSISSNEIELSWDKQFHFARHGEPDYFIVLVRDSNSGKTFEHKAKENIVIIRDLEICSRYCLRVRSNNKAGLSEITENICTYTLASKPKTVEIEDPLSGYTSTREIRWQYGSKRNCGRLYRISYSMNHIRAFLDVITNETSVMLVNLTQNVLYVMKIQAENQMETINNENIGSFSYEKEFYTGFTHYNLFSYNVEPNKERNLTISWSLTTDLKEAFFEFIIIVQNGSEYCIYSVHLQCGDCPDPWKPENLKTDHLKRRQEMILCKPRNESFSFSNLSFHHTASELIESYNLFIEIYGINLFGVHLLNKSNITASVGFFTASNSIFLSISFFIFLLFCICIIIWYKKNRNSAKTLKGSSTKYKEVFQSYEFEKVSTPRSSNLSPLEESNISENKPENIKESVQWRELKPGVNVSNFANYLERVKKNNFKLLIKEFKNLSAESKSIEAALGLTFQVASHSSNLKKNRYENIFPFDQNRVKLIDKRLGSDYINASYIPFSRDESKIEYIASQGPIHVSVSDFWQMIWEQNIKYILMLTQTEEDKKFQCIQYWPNNVGETLSYGFENNLTVTLVKDDAYDSHCERTLIVKNQETREQRFILHFYTHCWNSNSSPDYDLFDNLLFRFQEIAHSSSENPYLIHCSAGVNRTGTFITIDKIIQDLVNGSEEINIFETILKLRQYRGHIVQRQAQYNFIHEYINHFLSKYMQLETVKDEFYCNDD